MAEKKTYQFTDLRQSIIDKLKERSESVGIAEPVTILDGFVTKPFKTELTGAFTVGGPTIPMIVLLGEKSGRVYFFALKALLPELEL